MAIARLNVPVVSPEPEGDFAMSAPKHLEPSSPSRVASEEVRRLFTSDDEFRLGGILLGTVSIGLAIGSLVGQLGYSTSGPLFGAIIGVVWGIATFVVGYRRERANR